MGPTGALGVVGVIDVYFTGVLYLSKVVVNSYISSTSTHYFNGPENNIILINNLSPFFNFPVSVSSMGRNFFSTSDPSVYRYVNLFNNNSCRFDIDFQQLTMTFSNATPTSLGCPATNNLPNTETLVAKIFISFVQQ
jgi:hypothetical protein